MQLTKEDSTFRADMARGTACTGHLMRVLKATEGETPTGQLDSIQPLDDQGNRDYSYLPEPLVQILQDSEIANSPVAQRYVLDGLVSGIEGYKALNGGDMPPNQTILAGLAAGKRLLDAMRSGTIEGQAIDASVREAKDSMLDSLSFEHHESLSVVPAMVSVTITSLIANTLPIIAQLPNPTGSNEVPFIIGQLQANVRRGHVHANQRLDGINAGRQYIDTRYLAKMNDNGSGTYTVVAKAAYKDGTRDELDTATQNAPIMGGRVVIRVNMREVANDANRNHPTKGGISNLSGTNAEIKGQRIGVTSGTANLDTSEISVTLTGVPEGAVVHAEYIIDYERKDANGNPLIQPPGADFGFNRYSIFARPVRARNFVTIDAATQMRNELALDPLAVATGLLQQKDYQEKAMQLLFMAATTARAEGRAVPFDYDRGVPGGLVKAFNTTADGIAYMNSIIESIKLKIRNLTMDQSGVDIIVGDNAAIWLGITAEGSRLTRVPGADLNNQSMTKVATYADGTNLYHIPTSSGVLGPEDATTATIMVVTRGSRPEFCPFVGHVAVPAMFLSFASREFEVGGGYYGRSAAELNPCEQFSSGVYLIDLINMPALDTVK